MAYLAMPTQTSRGRSPVISEGEEYADKTRGPLNEGGLYAERNGYHLPNPPSGPWEESEPFDGLFGAGVYFYTTKLRLEYPGWL